MSAPRSECDPGINGAEAGGARCSGRSWLEGRQGDAGARVVLQDAKRLVKDGALVGGQIDDAVGDDHVDRRVGAEAPARRTMR